MCAAWDFHIGNPLTKWTWTLNRQRQWCYMVFFLGLLCLCIHVACACTSMINDCVLFRLAWFCDLSRRHPFSIPTWVCMCHVPISTTMNCKWAWKIATNDKRITFSVVCIFIEKWLYTIGHVEHVFFSLSQWKCPFLASYTRNHNQDYLVYVWTVSYIWHINILLILNLQTTHSRTNTTHAQNCY